ncbi:MAG: DoxX family membrane protein [Bacteroidia bacterium]|nr:DoxX family membrane protein [Bacteroidia bacterium]
MLKKILFTILCLLMGAVFIFSGYTKLYPIEPFEYTFVDLGFINWQIAPFIARLMIAAEFIIGILLILHINLKTAYKLAIATLLIFCVYLILLMIIVGNKGNCGCFGTTIQMTPLHALIKNIGMLGAFAVLYKLHPGWEWKDKKRYLLLIPIVTSLAMPFILNPVELDYSQAYLNKPEENFKLELDSLYNNATLNIPPKTLSEGKHVIAFMSLKCPHCRIAAKKIRIMHERNPDISFYFVLNGDEENLKPFFEDTHTETIPHCMLLGKSFVYLAGMDMPTIYLVNNSVVEHWVNYIDLDQSEIEKWMEQ